MCIKVLQFKSYSFWKFIQNTLEYQVPMNLPAPPDRMCVCYVYGWSIIPTRGKKSNNLFFLELLLFTYTR